MSWLKIRVPAGSRAASSEIRGSSGGIPNMRSPSTRVSGARRPGDLQDQQHDPGIVERESGSESSQSLSTAQGAIPSERGQAEHERPWPE